MDANSQISTEQRQGQMAAEITGIVARYNGYGLGPIELFHVFLNHIGSLATSVQAAAAPDVFEAYREVFVRDAETMLVVLRAPNVRAAAEEQARIAQMVMAQAEGRPS